MKTSMWAPPELKTEAVAVDEREWVPAAEDGVADANRCGMNRGQRLHRRILTRVPRQLSC